MKLTVYVDILLIVNVIINYFLLKITALTAHIPYNLKRVVLSSAVGAFFSLFIFWENMNSIFSIGIKLLSVFACCFIAFGFMSLRAFFRNLLCLGRANTILAGFFILLFQYSDRVYENNLFWYINISPVMLVLSIFCVYTVISVYDLFFENKNKNAKCDFEIQIKGKKKILSGFYDTGFGVKDIIGRKAVVLCRFKEILDILEPEIGSAVIDFMKDSGISDRKIIPIFYSDISSAGMLPAIRPDKFTYIGKQKPVEIKDILIALTDKEFSDDVRLIFGKDIFNMIGEHI